MEPMIANPLGWAQVMLYGGWRRLLTTAGVYVGVILLVHVLIYRAMKTEGMSLMSFANGALAVMVTVMAIVLFFLGSNAIKRAVHRDFTTDMIASHRISRMSGHTAVFGYLTGATAQASALTVVNLLTCTVLAMIAGHPAHGPVLLLIVLGCFVLMCWCFGVLTALVTRGTTSILGLLVVLALLMGSPALGFLPGLALLLGITTISTLSTAAATGIADPSVFVSMIAQLVFALAFFAAAARKFTRDDVQAFNPLLAHVLLALCALIAAVALRFYPGAGFTRPMPRFAEPITQYLVTVSSIALVAFLPVASAAKASADWARRKAKDPDYTRRRPAAFWSAPLIAAFVVFGIFALVLTPCLPTLFPPASRSEILLRAGWAAGFFLLSLVAVGGLLRFTYACSSGALWILGAYVLVVWAIPPLADLALEFAHDGPLADARTVLFACSPVGAWIIVFDKASGPLWLGLIVQALLAVCSLALVRRARY